MSDYKFFGNQDLGELGYDAWKTHVPEYHDDYEEDECWHENEEIDILTGRALCPDCGSTRQVSKEEFRSRARAEREHDRAMRRHARRERWRALADDFHVTLNGLRTASGLPPKITHVDEIPF